MSEKYTISAHEVTASRISKLLPLYDRSGAAFMSPSKGVSLQLENGRKVRWLIEDNSHVPEVGDWVITDSVLGTTCIVSSKVFETLCSKVEA